ncbi:MAG: MFS transporter [Chloroflexales bacterium]
MLIARRYLGAMRRLGPDVGRYFMTIALVGFAVDGGVYSTLLNLFLNRLGYGPENIGLVHSVGALIFAFASLPAGMLGERWGSRRIMLLGLGLLTVSATLLPLADVLPAAARMPWLLTTITGLYLGLALYFVNTAPLLLGFVASDQRNQAYATQTALIALAAFLGSLAGGLLPALIGATIGVPLTEPAPYRYGLLVAGLAIIPALLAIAKTRPVAVRDAPAPAPAAGAPASAPASILGLLALIALVRTLQVAGLAAMSTFFNLYLDTSLRIPTAQIGLLLALGRLAGVPAALGTAALSARFGNRSVVIGASLATAIGMLPITLIPHWAAAGLSLMAVFSLSSVRYAASMVYFLDLVPPSRRATIAGVTEMSAGVCFTAMTFGGGYVIALLGYPTLFAIGAALTALSALIFWAGFRRRG